MAELRLDLSIDQDSVQCYGDEDDLVEGLEEMDPLGEEVSDPLTPLERLDKYFQSEDMMERELAVRCIYESAQMPMTYAEFELLLEITFALANDHEPVIRMGVLGTVGLLLDRNAELGGEGEEFAGENEERLIDVPIRMLSDINQQVRRVSENCVLCLLEERGNKDVLLQQLCPTIVRCLNKDGNYDLRMDTALLISRLASLFGRELCMKYFVPLFPSLGSDTMFHVRKAFAMSCKELCPVLGEEATEEHVLPIFLKLCKDEVWGVRKACADVFMDVSATCNLGTRHDYLTPVFLKLLHDDSRWVRKAAFQALGPFIATFYVPLSDDSPTFDDTSLEPLGDSILMDNSLLSGSVFSSSNSSGGSSTLDSDSEDRHPGPVSDGPSGESPTTLGSTVSTPVQQEGGVDTGTTGGQKMSDLVTAAEEGAEFNNFQFWRSPISVVGGKGEFQSGLGPPLQLEDLEGEDEDDERLPSSEASSGNLCGAQESKVGPQRQAVVHVSDEHVVASGANEEHVTMGRGEKKDTLPGNVGAAENLSQVEDRMCSEEEQSGDTVQSVNTAEVTASAQSTGTGSGCSGCQVSGGGDVQETAKEDNEVASVLRSERLEKGEKEEGREGGDGELSQPGGGTGTVPRAAEDTKPAEEKAKMQETEAKVSSLAELKGERRGGESGSGVLADRDEVNSTQPKSTKVGPQEPLQSVEGHSDSNKGVRTPPQSASLQGNESEGEKKRRWSLEKTLQTENNTFPQVRVFVHSATGQVTEKDLSYVDHEPYGEEEEEGVGAHNKTTTKSVSMDLTLCVDSVSSEPNLTTANNEQEVIPDELMELYIGMTDQLRAQLVDSDLPYHCAYSLPAVALTLGREHWKLLKPTFNLLAADMQWKVRRVLAYSLHELARILGPEHTCTDLFSVFQEYCTKDIDDVKIGAVSHLTEFFELLPFQLRVSQFPPILKGLQDMENERNWRYRNMLAEQLILLCDLYDCDYLQTHIYPAALMLAEDKVAEVRNTATQLLGVLIQRLSRPDLGQALSLVQELRGRYASHKRWLFRLMYVKQCESFLLDGRISCGTFAAECLPTILLLSRDKVPNIRIAIAKLLKESVLSIDYFQTDGKDTFSLTDLQNTLECLQNDLDRDVKYFAGGDITEIAALRQLPRQQQQQQQRRMRTESRDSEEQYQDAAEYLDPELVDLEDTDDLSNHGQTLH